MLNIALLDQLNHGATKRLFDSEKSDAPTPPLRNAANATTCSFSAAQHCVEFVTVSALH